MFKKIDNFVLRTADKVVEYFRYAWGISRGTLIQITTIALILSCLLYNALHHYKIFTIWNVFLLVALFTRGFIYQNLNFAARKRTQILGTIYRIIFVYLVSIWALLAVMLSFSFSGLFLVICYFVYMMLGETIT
jgi:hypothetical protein